MVSRHVGGLLAVLAVPARALVRVHTGAEVEADSEAIVSMATLSAEEWEKAHESTYEKEFTVELDMTLASRGVAIGAELWSQSDHDPLVVLKKGDVGLVETWNRAHPEKAVQVGDEIFRVGDFKWKHRNEIFIGHLKKQFGILKEQKQGMPTVLELGIRRPRKANAQPEAPVDTEPPSLLGTDAQVTRVFEVDLDPSVAYSMVDQNFNTPTASDMTVSKIPPGSPIDVFNKANPTNQVHVGDTVTAVNGALWSGNSMMFLKMHKMVELSHKAGKPGKGEPSVLPLKLRLQRRQ